MIARETLNDHAGELDLAVEEDAVVRNEYVIEDDQHFVAAVNLVADVDIVVLLQLAGIAGLAAIDQGDAFGIGRYSEGDRVVLVALTHGDGRHNQNLVRVDKTGLMRLCAGDVNAVRGALDNMQEQIGIGLLGGSEGTVALDVGHRAVNCQVLILHTGQDLTKFSWYLVPQASSIS